MNETMQTILTRRSTRKFKVQEIPQTDLDQILRRLSMLPAEWENRPGSLPW